MVKIKITLWRKSFFGFPTLNATYNRYIIHLFTFIYMHSPHFYFDINQRETSNLHSKQKSFAIKYFFHEN